MTSTEGELWIKVDVDDDQPAKKTMTAQEVALHKVKKGCYVIINTRVYDVSLFLDKHPGGASAIMSFAGKDATTAFEDIGHSLAARKLLDKYYIADLKSETSKDPSPVPSADKNDSVNAFKLAGPKSSDYSGEGAESPIKRKSGDTAGPRLIPSRMQSLKELARPIQLPLESDDFKATFKYSSKEAQFSVFVFICCLISLFWVWITTFGPDPIGLLKPKGTGPGECPCEGFVQLCVCDRPCVTALDFPQMFLALLSRSNAYFDYPLVMLIFLSKCNNIKAALQNTYLSEWIPLCSMHHYHGHFGVCIFWSATLHTVCHIIRFGLQGRLHLMYSHITGWTGMVTYFFLFFIVFPMRWAWLKDKMSFEFRKGLHYLSVPWGLILMWHAPNMPVYYLVGIPTILYGLDWTYGFFFRTYHIQSSHFIRLEGAVQLTFEKPAGFDFTNIGYIYLNIPWISTLEWHAFSLYPHAEDANKLCVCIAVSGDWTEKLYHALSKPTVRPAWVYGPFPSPFEVATTADNAICVASGIGITPAICVINKFSTTRLVHLIWMCREASLIEFCLESLTFDSKAWTLIFYTGQRELIIPNALPPNVLLFKGRPDIQDTICRIIVSSATTDKAALTQKRAVLRSTLTKQQSPSRDNGDIHNRALTSAVESTFNEHSFVDDEKNVDQVFQNELKRMLLRYSTDEIFAYAESMETRDGLISPDGLQRALVNLGVRRVKKHTARLKFWFDTVNVNDADDETLDKGEFYELIEILKTYVSRTHGQHNQDAFGYTRMQNAWDQACPSFAIDSIPQWAFQQYQLMYCGGSAPVVEILQEFEKKFSIPLSIEKFDW